MVEITYPNWADDNQKKMYFLLKLKRKLKNEFNKKGKMFREKKIKKEDFENYKNKHIKRCFKASGEYIDIKEKLKEDKSESLDELDKIFSE